MEFEFYKTVSEALTALVNMDLMDFNQLKAIAAIFAILVAFLVGFLGLIARERKSPYLINRFCWLFLIYFISVFNFLLCTIKFPTPYNKYIQLIALTTLAFSILATIISIYKVRLLLVLYTDAIRFRDLYPCRHLKALWRRIQDKPTYEHTAQEIPKAIQDGIKEIYSEAIKNLDESQFSSQDLCHESLSSLLLLHDKQCLSDTILSKLAKLFLVNGFIVQYTSVSRHPIDFIESLKSSFDSEEHNWSDFSQNIIVVDGYTPHFGFMDSIYHKLKSSLTKSLNTQYIKGKQSFAGIHACSAKAFNILKKKANKTANRKYALVIYDGCYAISDLESVEQYKVFVRHMLPSEKAWRGMLTIFSEAGMDAQAEQLVKFYSSYWIKQSQGEDNE